MSQHQKSPHEDFIMAFLVGSTIFGLAWVIWFFFHAQLTETLRWIRISEMWLATLLGHGDFTVEVPELTGMQSLKDWRDWLPEQPVSKLNFPYIQGMTYVAVLPLRNFFVGGLVLMIVWAVFFNSSSQYRRRMKLEDLMKEQAKSFPAIAPFLKFNPRNMPYRVIGQAVPAKLPLFSEALSPEEWIAFHEIKMQNQQVDINTAWQALALQLGKRWQGPMKLSVPAQGIYAACALRHARKRTESEDLLNQMSLNWTQEKGLQLPFKVRSQIYKVINDPKIGGALRKYADQHAFETTALLRCLQRAREEGGVLASASFLWLRGSDRNLWYPLNNLGRRSYHAEAVGALVHYTNELIAGQKIPTPRFEDVIKGIETFLKSPGARPIPPLDKTAGEKKGK